MTMWTLIPLPYRIFIVLAAVAALFGFGWHSGSSHATAVMTAEWDKQKLEASAALTAETQKTADAERALATAKSNQEVKDAANSNAIDDLSGQLDRAVRVGLRDPNAKPGNCGGGPAGANPATAGSGGHDRAEADGLLSPELADLLQRLAREADDINNAYASCRAEREGLTSK